jgi:hypothetical protein
VGTVGEAMRWGVAQTCAGWSAPSIRWFDLCLDGVGPNKGVTRPRKRRCALAGSPVGKRHGAGKGWLAPRGPCPWPPGGSPHRGETGSGLEAFPTSSGQATAMTPGRGMAKSRRPRTGKTTWCGVIPPGGWRCLRVASTDPVQPVVRVGASLFSKAPPPFFFDALESRGAAGGGELAHGAAAASHRRWREEPHIDHPSSVEAMTRAWSVYGLTDQGVRLCVGSPSASPSALCSMDDPPEQAQPEAGSEVERLADAAFS